MINLAKGKKKNENQRNNESHYVCTKIIYCNKYIYPSPKTKIYPR